MKLYCADSVTKLKELDANSVDSVVTDPPYGLSFMGKRWDYDVPSIELWTEVLRVLKPGGHLLSFGGTRTYHRMVVNIEDAGFEIRDQIQWLYGSGFPKSHNISKGIDKKFGANPEKTLSGKSGSKRSSMAGDFKEKAATDLAKQWDGYGTALKPANEPIVLARKPLSEKTIVDNVLKWGTGGINIDGCRVGNETRTYSVNGNIKGGNFGNKANQPASERDHITAQGRFPANIILDESAGEMLGEPSRFFYCAKASKSERGAENNHPTVKPIKLMTYLTRLITPPGGTVLDPFMGSGTTGLAAKNEGFNFIGIEREGEYFNIAQKRTEST